MKKSSYSAIVAFLCILICTGVSYAQVKISCEHNLLVLENGLVKRQIVIGKNGQLTTSSYKLSKDNREFILKDDNFSKNDVDKFSVSSSDEFSFSLNDREFTGQSHWEYLSYEKIPGGIKLFLSSKEFDLKLGITYLIYPDLPIIRKKIEFLNTGTSELKLENLDIESLKIAGGGVGTSCWVMNDYGRQKHLGQFIGQWYDPVVVVHNHLGQMGVFVGNEAPGVMKRTSTFLDPGVELNPLCGSLFLN